MKKFKSTLTQISSTATTQGYFVSGGKIVFRFQFPKTNVAIKKAFLKINKDIQIDGSIAVYENANGTFNDGTNPLVAYNSCNSGEYQILIDLRKFYAQKQKEGKLNDMMALYVSNGSELLINYLSNCVFEVEYGGEFDNRKQKATLPFEVGNLQGYVDLRDRSLHYEKTLIKGYGRLPITLTQIFNSKKAYSENVVLESGETRTIYSRVGYGSKLNYNQYLIVDEGNEIKSDGESNGYYTWINGAGEHIHFRKNATTNVISCDENYKMTKQSAYKYVIEDFANNSYTFEQIGDLSYLCLKVITDKNGREITLYYDNNTKALTQIADENEQSIFLNYDDDLNLTSVTTGETGANNINVALNVDGDNKVYNITTPENFTDINVKYSCFYDENENAVYGVKAIYDGMGGGYYFDINENGEYVGVHSLSTKTDGIAVFDDYLTNVTLDGVSGKVKQGYAITYSDNLVRVTDLVNEKSLLYSFNYFGECISVLEESYNGNKTGNGMAREFTTFGEHLNASFKAIDGWDVPTISSYTSIFTPYGIEEADKNEFAIKKYVDENSAKTNYNCLTYTDAIITLPDSTKTKMKELNCDATLLVSAWARFDAVPFSRKVLGTKVGDCYYEKNYSDYINSSNNRIAYYNLNNNYNLCAKVTFSQSYSERVFKYSYDWQNNDYQYGVVAVNLSYEQWQVVSKIEVYLEIASGGNYRIYGISAMAGTYEIQSKNDFGATELVESDARLKTTYTYENNKLKNVEIMSFRENKIIASTAYVYDENNRLTSETTNNGLTTTYEYNNLGDVIKVKKFHPDLTNLPLEPIEITSEMVYNQYGQPTSNVNEFGEVVAGFGYSRGTVNFRTSPLLSSVNYGFDVTRQFLKSVDSTHEGETNLNRTSYIKGVPVSDCNGQTPLGGGNTEYSYEYDNFCRLSKIKVNGAEYCSFNYSNENRQFVRYDNGNEIYSVYSPTDNSVTLNYYDYVIDCDVEERDAQYNENGRYLSSSGGYNYHTVSYDNLGRVVSSVNENENDDFYSISVENEYSLGLGKLSSTTISHKTGENKYEIDKITKVIPTENADNLKVYNHTAIGEETAETDKLERVIKTTKKGGDLEKNYEYKTVGRRTSNLVSKETFKASLQNDRVLSYDYDSLGRVVQVNQIENGVSEVKIKYVYDGLGRLIQEQNAFMDKSSIYSYDNAGNITLKVEYCYNEYSPFDDSDYIQTTQYSYTNGRLNNVVVFDDYESEQSSCAYDEIGNPTNYLGKVATWSHGHRLDNFGGAHFTYNTSGIRTRKAINGVETKYLLNGTDIVCQQSSNGKTFKFYYGIDGVTAFDYNGDKYYYKKNIFGDIIGIYDSDNSFVIGYAYDAFGNFRFVDELGGDIYIIPEVAQLNPFRYRGYYYDVETKIYYLNARYYDPAIGRFLCPDSIEYLDPTTLGGLNLYAYCNNDPVNYSDGSGHAPEWIGNLLTGIGIVVGTALFVAAIVASAGTVGALVGVGAAAIGLSTTAVSTAITVATISTYVVAGGVGLFGASDAIEAFSGGINPIRDYVMGGNQTAYNITSGIFNALGTVAVIAGMVGPKVLQKIAECGGVPKISNGKTVGYSMDFFDKKGNWNFRIDATTHGNPNAAIWHHDPHYHVVNRAGMGNAVYYLWEIIKRWF